MPAAVDRYDLAVVGAGTAGLTAAQVAVAAGARVALIERARTGGDCLWTGCVPSKALLAAATTAHTIRHAGRVGIRPSEPEIDRAEVAAHVRRAQEDIAPQDSPERLRAMGIDVLDGHARFTRRDRLDVDGRPISFRAAVIATGSTPLVPDVLAGVGPLTTDTVWDALEDLPERLAVVGGGPTTGDRRGRASRGDRGAGVARGRRADRSGRGSGRRRHVAHRDEEHLRRRRRHRRSEPHAPGRAPRRDGGDQRPHAGESISALVDVVRRRGSIADAAATLHPYPTYSIAAYQAAARHRLAGLVDERVRAVNSRILEVLRIGADLRRRFTSRG